jgi:hypothetical protein
VVGADAVPTQRGGWGFSGKSRGFIAEKLRRSYGAPLRAAEAACRPGWGDGTPPSRLSAGLRTVSAMNPCEFANRTAAKAYETGPPRYRVTASGASSTVGDAVRVLSISPIVRPLVSIPMNQIAAAATRYQKPK